MKWNYIIIICKVLYSNQHPEKQKYDLRVSLYKYSGSCISSKQLSFYLFLFVCFMKYQDVVKVQVNLIHFLMKTITYMNDYVVN